MDGPKLIGLFALLMLIIAGVMFADEAAPGIRTCALNRRKSPETSARRGTGTGALSGFFGIGGGFLIVPGLMLAAGMPMMNAIGSSLVAVAAFGATAAVNYAVSGLVDGALFMLLAGGVAGGLLGTGLSHRSDRKAARCTTYSPLLLLSVSVFMRRARCCHSVVLTVGSAPALSQMMRWMSVFGM